MKMSFGKLGENAYFLVEGEYQSGGVEIPVPNVPNSGMVFAFSEDPKYSFKVEPTENGYVLMAYSVSVDTSTGDIVVTELSDGEAIPPCVIFSVNGPISSFGASEGPQIPGGE